MANDKISCSLFAFDAKLGFIVLLPALCATLSENGSFDWVVDLRGINDSESAAGLPQASAMINLVRANSRELLFLRGINGRVQDRGMISGRRDRMEEGEDDERGRDG